MSDLTKDARTWMNEKPTEFIKEADASGFDKMARKNFKEADTLMKNVSKVLSTLKKEWNTNKQSGTLLRLTQVLNSLRDINRYTKGDYYSSPEAKAFVKSFVQGGAKKGASEEEKAFIKSFVRK